MKRDQYQTKRETAATPGPTTGPKTLKELGVAGPLAAELEAALRWMGRVRGGRVLGHAFVTPDGVSHEVRVNERDPGEPSDRAA